MDPFEAQLWTPLFSVSLVYLLLGRGVNNRSMLWGERKALEPLDWLGLESMNFTTVLWWCMTT